MAHGGARRGAGRPKGSVNRLDQEAREKALEGESPLDFLLRIMRDSSQEDAKRLDAAKAAAPYCHAKLASVDVGNKDDKPFEQTLRWASTPDEATPDPSRS